MEEKILKELQEIKKELQDIRSILEPKEIKIMIGEDVIINTLNKGIKEQGKTLISV